MKLNRTGGTTMNKAKLTALCHKISKNTGLTFNSVMTYYFLEAILKKIKSGVLIRITIFFLKVDSTFKRHWVESRSTIDIDFLFHKQTFIRRKYSTTA